MPSTPAEMAEYFRKSRYFTRLQEDMNVYKVRASHIKLSYIPDIV